jgi:ATP-dependent RNA helicase RhlE
VYGYTEDSDLPDFVLYRPNNAASEKKASREIKELVASRKAAKQQAPTRNPQTAGSGRSTNPESKSGSGRRNQKVGKKSPRAGGPQGTNQRKPKGKR